MPLYPLTVELFHSLATLSFLFFFSLFATKQDRLAREERTLLENPLVNPLTGEVKDSEQSSLSDQKAFDDLVRFMNQSKPYLDCKLNLQNLSDQAGLGRNDLSRIINDISGDNFFHFINGFRAREFQAAVKEKRYPEYTLLSIAFECGFNSKSTFNAAVKREFEKTPSQIYREM